jgi:hypothetical protein
MCEWNTVDLDKKMTHTNVCARGIEMWRVEFNERIRMQGKNFVVVYVAYSLPCTCIFELTLLYSTAGLQMASVSR